MAGVVAADVRCAPFASAHTSSETNKHPFDGGRGSERQALIDVSCAGRGVGTSTTHALEYRCVADGYGPGLWSLGNHRLVVGAVRAPKVTLRPGWDGVEAEDEGG